MYDKLVRISLGRDFSNFEPYTVKFSDLPNLLCAPNVLYSPTQYRYNQRKSANYLGYADFLVLELLKEGIKFLVSYIWRVRVS